LAGKSGERQSGYSRDFACGRMISSLIYFKTIQFQHGGQLLCTWMPEQAEESKGEIILSYS